LATLMGVGLLGLITSSARVRRRSGVGGLDDPRSVALVLGLMTVATLLASPVQNTISRHVELRADLDALRVSSPEAMVDLQRDLCLRAVCDPTPPVWSQFWFGSHPTVLERSGLVTNASESPNSSEEPNYILAEPDDDAEYDGGDQ
ncbi:MAG TPA: M48 family metalloprotease, partial [Nocardioides sp.]